MKELELKKAQKWVAERFLKRLGKIVARTEKEGKEDTLLTKDEVHEIIHESFKTLVKFREKSLKRS